MKMEKINLFLVLISLSVVYVKVFADDAAPSNCSEESKKKFEEWKQKFDVTYSSPEEETKRREIFCANKRKVSDHNQKDNSSYTRSENVHSDKSKQEKDENMLGAKRPANVQSKMNTIPPQKVNEENSDMPQTDADKKTRAPFTTRQRSTFKAMPQAQTKPQTVRGVTTTKATTTKVTTKKPTTQKPTTKPTTMKPTTKPTTAKLTTKATTKTLPKMTTTQAKTTTTATTAQSGTIDSLLYPVKSGIMPDYLNYTSDCSPVKDQYGCGSCWVILDLKVFKN